ncbi:MAG: DinB family protein [Armatimonadota bacterium]
MNAQIESAINDLTNAKDLMVRALANTQDDRVTWSPGGTARTALQIVTHSAFSLDFISTMLKGSPYPTPTMAEADAEFLEMERPYNTRELALGLLEKNYQKYVETLKGFDQSDFDTMIDMPFKLGSVPLGAILAVGALHTRTHTSQIEYLQTIYGDRVW